MCASVLSPHPPSAGRAHQPHGQNTKIDCSPSTCPARCAIYTVEAGKHSGRPDQSFPQFPASFARSSMEHRRQPALLYRFYPTASPTEERSLPMKPKTHFLSFWPMPPPVLILEFLPTICYTFLLKNTFRRFLASLNFRQNTRYKVSIKTTW